MALRPPSTDSVAPWMLDASSLARNTTALPAFRRVLARREGTRAMIGAMRSASAAVFSVAVGPGATVLTRQQCPLNALISQLGRMTPGAQAVVAQLMTQWQSQIAVGVRNMQAAGEVAQDLDADRTAAAMLAGIQGGWS